LQKAIDYARRNHRIKDVVRKLTVADGDYVAVYSESLSRPPLAVAAAPAAPPRPPNLVGDIYRLDEHSKIVEHWNAIYTP